MSACRADCTIGPNADHHGTMSYRCMGEHGEALPFPGEPFATYDMGSHLVYLFPEDGP